MAISPPELRILLVEDSDLVRETLSLVLSKRGYVVRSADSAAAALECISGYQPDVLLCDVFLPDSDGIKVAMEICRRLPRCRIILVSGYPKASEILERAAEEGVAFEVLPKPVHPDELYRILEQGKSNSGAS